MKKLHSFVFIVLVCVFMTLEPLTVFAVGDIDNDKDKSLTVYFYTQKVGVDTPIEGAKIGIAKIADIKVENGNIVYDVVDKYNDLSDTKFEGITVNESKEIAKKFDNIVEIEQIGITGIDGLCKFDISDNGIYLVRHISSSGEAERYTKFEPYIIIVPFISEVNTDWVYEVLSEPKTAMVVDVSTVEQSSKPEQSDDSDVESSGYDISDDSGWEPSGGTESDYSDGGTSRTEQSDNSVLTGDKTKNIMLIFGGLFCLSALLMVILTKKGVDNDA